MDNKPLLTPARLLFVFTFLTQFAADTYAIMQVELPDLVTVIWAIAPIWLFWLWLREDSRNYGINWVLDLGMFLFMAWPLILPYHLFKTPGLKAFIPILAYVLTILLGTLAAAVVTSLLG